MATSIVPSERNGIGCLWIAGVLLLIFVGFIYWNVSKFQRWKHSFAKEDIRRQREDLLSGRTHMVYIYDLPDTDTLLETIRGMPEVEELQCEMARDFSPMGMECVATLPKLKKLILYASAVDDQGLSKIAGNTSLESITLKNTFVTDEGLRVLKTLSNLRRLDLFFEAWRKEKPLSDDGLAHLVELHELEELTLDGGWATEAGVEELRNALPKCEIKHNPTSDGQLNGR